MATGASTADLAILLVDARHGVREQTRRHARIAELLGITNLVLAVNKMDLVEFDRGVFDEICREFAEIQGDARVHAIPVSALNGDNVITRATVHPGSTARACSNTSRPSRSIERRRRGHSDFRCSWSSRPSDDFRGYAGQICSGVVRVGDAITVWPANRSSRVKRIVTWDGDLDEAFAPMSVTLTLEDELDISRGDVLAIGADRGRQAGSTRTSSGWTSGRSIPVVLYLLKHGATTVSAEIDRRLQAERDRHGDRGRVAPDRVRQLSRRIARPAASS